MRVRILDRVCAALAALALVVPLSAAAQATGAIGGSVRGADGEIVRGAQVVLAATGQGTLSNDMGEFVLARVPVGTHTITVTRLGYEEARVIDVAVRAGETARVDVTLRTGAVDLGGVVVSASRRQERLTEAPATVTRIGEEEIALSVGNSFSGALKQVQGLDFIQVGATAVAVNARGFNSSFNNRMLMLEDNRVSVLPESGLPIGIFTAVPKIDLEGLEVIVGPGAALYGADASNGVLSIQTKDPLEHPGTTVEVSSGVLEKDGDESGMYNDIQFRHAGVHGKLGYKVAGEWQSADDWSNNVSYLSGGVQYPELEADFSAQVKRAEGALVWYEGLSKIQLSAGMSSNDGIGQTNVGRNQFIDWTYNFLQLQANTPHWYVNVYRNQSQSGESFALNRYSVNRALPAYATMTDEEVKKASDWPSNGRLYAAEVQNRFAVSDLLSGEGNAFMDTEVVWGAQVRRDIVSSDREWLTDRFEDEDVVIGTAGLYAQTRTPLHPMLDVILAARYDTHDNYDAQFSPKAGVIFKPAPGHAVRATYNRAFKSPTILQTNFWIPDFVPFVGVFGNTQGFTVRQTGQADVYYAPLAPEENTTWELGYKAALGERFFVDATGYYADYTNFFSPLLIIANPFLGQVASFGTETAPILGETNNPQVVLTYFNLGEASVKGVDLGARYRVSEKVGAKATFSVIELDSRDIGTLPGGEEATSLNSPSTKWTLGADFSDLRKFLGGATVRYVNGYDFRSGINVGRIPTFTTFDIMAGYDLERFNSRITLNINNLFTCRSEDTALGPDDEAKCGLGVRHREMVNMPHIGTMMFLGVRVHR